jgi:Flp pilus assembly protein TadG
MARRRRARRAANAIEFALTLPMYVLLLGWVVDGAWLVYQSTIVEGAAQFGCRAGAIVDPGKGLSTVQNVITTAEESMLDEIVTLGGACTDCSATATVEGARPGRVLMCTARNGYDPLFGIMDRTTLVGSAMRRMEWQR